MSARGQKPVAFWCSADRHKRMIVERHQQIDGQHQVRIASFAHSGAMMCEAIITRTGARRMAQAILHFQDGGVSVPSWGAHGVRNWKSGNVMAQSIPHGAGGRSTTYVTLTQTRDGTSMEHALAFGPMQRQRLIETLMEAARG